MYFKTEMADQLGKYYLHPEASNKIECSRNLLEYKLLTKFIVGLENLEYMRSSLNIHKNFKCESYVRKGMKKKALSIEHKLMPTNQHDFKKTEQKPMPLTNQHYLKKSNEEFQPSIRRISPIHGSLAEKFKFTKNNTCERGKKQAKCISLENKEKGVLGLFFDDGKVYKGNSDVLLMSECKERVHSSHDKKNSFNKKLAQQKLKTNHDVAIKKDADGACIVDELALRKEKNIGMIQNYIKKHNILVKSVHKAKEDYHFALNFSSQNASITNILKQRDRSKFIEYMQNFRFNHIKSLNQKTHVKKVAVKIKQMDLY